MASNRAYCLIRTSEELSRQTSHPDRHVISDQGFYFNVAITRHLNPYGGIIQKSETTHDQKIASLSGHTGAFTERKRVYMAQVYLDICPPMCTMMVLGIGPVRMKVFYKPKRRGDEKEVTRCCSSRDRSTTPSSKQNLTKEEVELLSLVTDNHRINGPKEIENTLLCTARMRNERELVRMEHLNVNKLKVRGTLHIIYKKCFYKFPLGLSIQTCKHDASNKNRESGQKAWHQQCIHVIQLCKQLSPGGKTAPVFGSQIKKKKNIKNILCKGLRTFPVLVLGYTLIHFGSRGRRRV